MVYSRLAVRLYLATALNAAGLVAQTVSLALGSGTGVSGTQVTVPLNLSAATGSQPAALQWTVGYSTADIAGVSMAPGAAAAAAGKALACAASPGRYTCLLSGPNASLLGSGTVATVTLALSAATAIKSSPVQLLAPSGVLASGLGTAVAGVGGTLTLLPPPRRLQSLGCGQAALTGPGTVNCQVSLAAAAPAGGISVTLGKTHAAGITVSMPGSVLVAAGATTASFAVQVSPVTAVTTVALAASLNGLTLNFTLTVNPPAGGSYSVRSSASTVASGGSLSVSWTAPGGSAATDWVALYPVGVASNTNGFHWRQYTKGLTSGSYTLTAPIKADQYEFRYFLRDTYREAARSSVVAVTATQTPTYTLASSSYSVRRSGSMTVSWKAPAGGAYDGDWIALYPVGVDSRTNAYTWRGSVLGATSGKLTLKAPATAGQYEFRYLLRESYTEAARSAQIKVY